jgi:hypothetical protein
MNYKLNFITFTNKSNIWLYIIGINHWDILKKHLSFSENTYLPSFKYEKIMNNDIVIIYVKSMGFTCITKILKQLIPHYELQNNQNNQNTPNIFEDKSICKFYTELKDIYFFIKPIAVSQIVAHTDEKIFQQGGAFGKKYCGGEFIYKFVEFKLGVVIIKCLDTITKIDKNIVFSKEKENERKNERKNKDIHNKKENLKKICLKVIKKNNTNQYSTASEKLYDNFEISFSESYDSNKNNESESNESNISNTSNESSEYIGIEDIPQKNIIPMIPILFDPCDEFRWYEECINDNDFIEEFKAHYKRCGECEINDNNLRCIIPYFECSNISINIASSDDDAFNKIFNAYQTGKEKIILDDDDDDNNNSNSNSNSDDNDNDSNNNHSHNNDSDNIIRLYIINEEDHLYNNTIIIEWGVNMSVFTKAEIIE